MRFHPSAKFCCDLIAPALVNVDRAAERMFAPFVSTEYSARIIAAYVRDRCSGPSKDFNESLDYALLYKQGAHHDFFTDSRFCRGDTCPPAIRIRAFATH